MSNDTTGTNGKAKKIRSIIGNAIFWTAAIVTVVLAVAAVVGYICIKTMLVIVRKKKFTVFAIYCLLVGALSIGGYFYLA